MHNTKIEWADHTFNPWIGCAKISEGCLNCYAATLNNRFKRAEWRKGGHRHKTGDAVWKQPFAWNREAEGLQTPQRVFCASLADIFESNTNDEMAQWREELHRDLILNTPMLEWLLLTKRPENIAPYYKGREIPFNVWLGTTVENQKRAEERIPILINNNAAVRFLSCEPLLGPLDLRKWLPEIQWVIVGGESGHNFRPINPEWVKDIRNQCIKAGVPFLFKQWSGLHPHKLGRLLEGRTWDEVPEPRINFEEFLAAA